jgi:F420-dependent oxidoreductase-like protein
MAEQAAGDFCVFLEGQEGGTYEQILADARWGEELGFGGFFRSDHWLPIMSAPTTDATDAWATLAGLARETARIRLGTMVSPVTFRHPSEYAKIVATVDQMSGGRVEAGFGTGWNEAEHAAYGVPFPPLGERFDRLEEALEVCTRLWGEAEAAFEGRHYRLERAPGAPKPAQRPRPSIIVGGKGPKRTPELAARFADEFNSFGGDAAEWGARREQVVRACERLGRDPTSLRCSWAGPTVVGTDERDLRRRAERRMAHTRASGDAGAWIAEQQERGLLVGTVDQVAERIRALRGAGCSRWYLQTVPLGDHEMLELIARELAPLAA